MFESTALSEGRETTRPFELPGPRFCDAAWRKAMPRLGLLYTKDRFACFEPSMFCDHTCCGLQTYWSLNSVCAHEKFDQTYVGVALLSTGHRLDASENYGSRNETASCNWVSSGSGNEKEYNIGLRTGASWIRKPIDKDVSHEKIRAD